MFKRNLLSTAILTASLIAVSTISMAETVTSSATVTVQNAFNLTEVAAINFGTLRATGDASGGVATVAVKSDGSAATVVPGTVAGLSIITPGERGEYTIDGAAPFSDLNIIFPQNEVELVNASAPPNSPIFTIAPATNWKATIIGGTNTGDDYSSGNLQTDVTGTVGFYLGATLSTDERTSGQNGIYTDGAYTGNYTVEVTY